MHVAHGEAAKAMQAYIRKIEEEAPEDESMEVQEGEQQGGQQTITIATEDGGEEQTVYQMSDGTYQAVVTDGSHVSQAVMSDGSFLPLGQQRFNGTVVLSLVTDHRMHEHGDN